MKNSLGLPKKISALTLNIEHDGWNKAHGFLKKLVETPILDEKKDSRDATAVIIKMQFAGVCGTDRGMWHRQVFRDLIHDSLGREGKKERIVGHEFVGAVVMAGSQVGHLYGINVGDMVSGDSHVTCGRCFQCRMGEEEVCQDQAILGISIDGVFADYVKIPAKNLWGVDFTRIKPEVAALFDPFGNAVHATSKVDLRGKRIAILGCGPIGMFTVLLARAFGAAKVIVADPNQKNLAMAKALGAHHTILLVPSAEGSRDADEKLVEAIRTYTYGKGVDATFEMAGPNESVINALVITRSGGEVVLFGLKDGDFTIPHFNRAIVKGLTLYGVIGRQIFKTWQVSQRMLSDKKNGIQEAIWNVILKKGKGTVMPFASYEKKSFEAAMQAYPKILFKF